MIGDRIKAVRESMGYKQKDFAEMLGMKPTTFNGYELGLHEPKSDVLIAIASKCNVTIDYLVGLSDEPHGTYLDTKNSLEPNLSSRELTEHEVAQKLLSTFSDIGILNASGDISDADLEFMKALFLLVKAHFGKA